MRYIVEWYMFDPLKSCNEYIGEDTKYEQRFRSYPEALKFSCEKIQEDFCHALFLTELDADENIPCDGEPILSYCP